MKHLPVWQCLSTLVTVTSGSTWTLVDVPMIECGRMYGQPHTQQIVLQEGSSFGNLQNPHAPTFIRTGKMGVKIDFEITDATGVAVVDRQTVELDDLTGATMDFDYGRRLSSITVNSSRGSMLFTRFADGNDSKVSRDPAQQTPAEQDTETQHVRELPDAADEGGNCEAFFLLDGRAPVDLPETWGEARASFNSMCVQEGYTATACAKAETLVFAGRPTGHEIRMDVGPVLCSRLLAHAAAIMEAPLHANGSVMNPHEVPIPMPSSTRPLMNAPMRRMKGGSSTGFSGSRGSFAQSSSRMRSNYPSGFRQTGYGYSGLGAFRMGTPVMLGLGLGAGLASGYAYHHYSYSRYNHYCTSDWDCNSPSGTMSYSLGTDASRDDIMTAGFTPADFSLPMTMTVYGVTGNDFQTSMMCPPPSELESTTWFSSQQFDLFVTVSEVDAGPPWWAAVLGGLFPCCICGCVAAVFIMAARGQKKQEGMDSDEAEQLHGQGVPLNQAPVFVGQRVRTKYEFEEGGDGRWYLGHIIAVHGIHGSQVTVKYDDGTPDWTGDAEKVYAVQHRGNE